MGTLKYADSRGYRLYTPVGPAGASGEPPPLAQGGARLLLQRAPSAPPRNPEISSLGTKSRILLFCALPPWWPIGHHGGKSQIPIFLRFAAVVADRPPRRQIDILGMGPRSAPPGIQWNPMDFHHGIGGSGRGGFQESVSFGAFRHEKTGNGGCHKDKGTPGPCGSSSG